MTELRFENISILAADLGEESSLADIHVNSYIRASVAVSDAVSEEDSRYIGKGMISTLLPYRIQDGYTRKRSPRTFKAAILENECLRATFIPQLGGRLWSLFDKREERELLYKNDVFQPANLALRNAWFSGGVEWNVGIKGHNPLTASPLFTQREYTESGNHVLKMYEYERIRGVVYIIEATLSDAALLVNITIENTSDKETPMYWWSNIAVQETPKTRVIAPADEMFFCAYTDGGYLLDKSSAPYLNGEDISYSINSSRSRDFFFNINNDSDKWIAVVDGDGKGLLHTSDPILKGRKLFVWGNHQGGRHWNKWLTCNAGPYVEIQAGLLKTQLEHFTMAANSRISWRECYTALTLDPLQVHGDFDVAADSISNIVSQNKEYLLSESFNITKKDPISQYGSGWGALESEAEGKSVSELCDFPKDSIGIEQKDWLTLLDGRFDRYNAKLPILSYAVGEKWLKRMENVKADGWYYHYHLGIMRYAAGDIEGAYSSFLKSIELEKNAWSYRNIAMIEKNINGNVTAAADYILLAVKENYGYRPLIVEAAQILLDAGRADLWIEIFDNLSDELRQNGRLRMLLGVAYARLGELSLAQAEINSELIVDDIKEGEYSLSSIWVEIYTEILAREKGVNASSLTKDEVLTAYPLPESLDFRMH